MIICIMSGFEPHSQSRNYIFLDQPCPIAHDNDIGIFLFHQLGFFLPSVRIFLYHQPGFFSAIRNEAFTARFLHRILSLLHRILSIFKDNRNWDFSLPSVGIHAQEAAAPWTPALGKLRTSYDNLCHEWS